jgi:F0F1-type ATP synthase membrane subunit c/vacuolar-type H+-ATPase subunit K
MAIAALGQIALAIGLIFAALVLASARAPWAMSSLTNQAFMGFALCETMALLLLLIVLLL